MSRQIALKRKVALLASCFAGLIVIVALTMSVTTNSQQKRTLNPKDSTDLLKRVENSADVPFNAVENDDSPFRIIEAKVKEISGSDFTNLTGKTTDLISVSSFPEVKLTNTSNKTIKSFFIVIRNAETHGIRGFIQSKVAIAPGQDYTVKREHFASAVKTTVADDKGVRENWTQPKFDSERFWIDWEKSPDVFVTVTDVTFTDESTWRVKEGGKVR